MMGDYCVDREYVRDTIYRNAQVHSPIRSYRYTDTV
jgi:hypothetical protein